MNWSGKNIEERIPVWEKLNLTIKEAAEYSNIGVNKIRNLVDDPFCPFVVCIGKRKIIKRKEFEKYMEKLNKL